MGQELLTYKIDLIGLMCECLRCIEVRNTNLNAPQPNNSNSEVLAYVFNIIFKNIFKKVRKNHLLISSRQQEACRTSTEIS
jgi:hypothetical protein